MAAVVTERVQARDGIGLAVHRLGEGRPAILLHGLFSNAHTNWIRYGHAQAVADAGFSLFMPDLRAHGQSDAPHDPAAYPRDILIRDLYDVVAHYGLKDFDLVGFSLGARTCAAAVIAGIVPRRLVLSGMGLEGLSGWQRRGGFFIDAIDRFDEIKRGDPAFFAVQFMKTTKVDRIAARHVLCSVGDVDGHDLGLITMPTLVLCGDQDRDNGSPQALVQALPDARLEEVSGTHMSSIVDPALGGAIADFLSA